jgi:uncharacterized protein YdiU (UPF0061 family)
MLTTQEQKTLQFIRNYLAQHGYAPKFKEIGMAIGVNPRYILRNYLLQQAIDKAESGDFSEVNNLFSLLQRPFDENPEYSRYAEDPPDWAKSLELSCSS